MALLRRKSKRFSIFHNFFSGFMMGFFSTVLASVLSLKGLFDHGHGYQRKEDTKTQVEIIQIPSKSEDHVYYDEHYKKGDLVPVLVKEEGGFI